MSLNSLTARLRNLRAPSGPGGGNSAPPAPPVTGRKDVRGRWLMVGMGFCAFVVVLSSITAGDNAKPAATTAVKAGTSRFVDLTPRLPEDPSGVTASQVELRALKEQLQAQSDAIQKLKDEQTRTAEELQKARRSGATGPNGMPEGIVPPPIPKNMGTPSSSGTSAPLGRPVEVDPNQVLPPLPLPPKSTGTPSSLPEMEPPEKRQQHKFKAPALSGVAAEKDTPVDSTLKYKSNPYGGFLPAGAFTPVVLLHGVAAGTSVATQSNPLPVLMRIQDNATLPGAAKYKLKSCFVIGSANGDLSSERVHIRAARLSCLDAENKLVMTTPFQGYLVDSDGVFGMRGVLEDRQGAAMGKALLAGFAQGLAGAFSAAQSTVTESALGAVSTITGDAALKASGLAGAQNAANQIAQFYLREAQNIFPVLTVGARRMGTLVFSDGISLKWGSNEGAYAAEVKPEATK